MPMVWLTPTRTSGKSYHHKKIIKMKKIFLIQAVIILFFTVPSSAQLIKMQTNVNNAVKVNAMSFVPEGVYFIRINETGKYFGIEGINPNNGARLVQWDFANQDNHKFQITKAADGYYYIKAMHSNRYLNVGGQSQQDGAIIIQWDFVEQDNLKWSFYYNKTTGTYTIRNKQTNKELKLQSGVTNAGNGALLSINGDANAGTQTFILQDVNAPAVNASKKVSQVVPSKFLNTFVDIKLADGSVVKRTISPNVVNISNKVARRENITGQSPDGCVTKVVKIDMDTKDFVPVTASNYLMFNAPGLIYDVRRFYSGDYTNKQVFPNGENRNPITITTTVRNKTGPITEPVQQPTINTINQAIKNLQDGYSVDPAQTASQNMIYRSSYVENNTEMQLKIGASAHYMVASFESEMAIKNTKETKTFYIEAEKELFTLFADKPQGGFLNGDVQGQEDLGYIASVSYGVKVVGKIEIKNTESSISGRFKAMIEAGFAGGSVDIAALSRESTKDVQCFFYVVGGVSEKVVGTNLADVYYRVNEILRTVNYKTCMPIRLTFRGLNSGNAITYKDATNSFPYEICVPKAIQEANKNYDFKINSLNAIGTDIELYGDVWVELWSPKYGDLSRFRTSSNSMLSLKQNVHLEKDDLGRYAINLPTVKYKNIPAELVKDAEVHIYYNLFDYNTVGSDDALKQRSGSVYVVPGTPPMAYFRSVIPLQKLREEIGGSLLYSTDFVDGDGVTMGIKLTEAVVITP
jgi:Ricin-type beta-trefoil lectin domain-like